MVFAGIAEFVLGNSTCRQCYVVFLADPHSAFPMAVFLIYGAHWGSLAYNQDPSHQTISGFEELGGANGVAYNSSQGFHNVSM
jgi:hypothetical protein